MKFTLSSYVVFTFNGCGSPCRTGISELKKRKVPFQEIEVNQNEADSDNFKLWEKSGRGSFPFIVSGKDKVMGSSKAQLATLLANNFGDQYLTSTEKRYFAQHFNADGSPKIVMYGVDWCPGCKKLRKEFKAANIDYLEIDVEKSGEKETMLQVMEIGGYPATWVGYTRVNGVTLRAVRELL